MFSRSICLVLISMAYLTIFVLIGELYLPLAYFIFSFFLVLTIVFILFKQNYSNLYVQFLGIILLFFILRTGYKFATSFVVLPLYDGYTDYGILRIFMENEKVFIPEFDTGFLTLELSSGWPLLHTLAWIFSISTGFDGVQTALLLPIIIQPINLLTIYLLAKGLNKELGLSNVQIIATLMFAAMSFSTYYDMQFTRFPLATSFFLILMFLLYKFSNKQVNVNKAILDTGTSGFARAPHSNPFLQRLRGKNLKLKILFFFFILTLTLTHVWVSFVFALTLLVFYTLPRFLRFAGPSILKRKIKTDLSLKLPLFYVFIAFLSPFLWWIFYAGGRGPIFSYLNYFLGFLRTLQLSFGQEVSLRLGGGYSETLRPFPYINLLFLREALVFGSAGIALLIMFIKWLMDNGKKKFNTSYVLLNVISLMTIFVLFNVTGLMPQRVISLAPAFVAICSAIFFAALIAKRKLLYRVTISATIFLVLFTSFISPWSMSYIPLYVYDPSIRMEDVGVHNPLYPFLGSFIDERCNLDYYFLVDDPEPMCIIFPSSKWYLIKYLYDRSIFDLYGQANTYVVELIKLDFQARPSYDNIEVTSTSEKAEIKDLIYSRYNIILDSHYFRLRISRNST